MGGLNTTETDEAAYELIEKEKTGSRELAQENYRSMSEMYRIIEGG